MTLRELKLSNLVDMLILLDSEPDINKINDFFSYEHFYVIYCKFWELDTDHDSLLDAEDLLKYVSFFPRIPVGTVFHEIDLLVVLILVESCGHPMQF